MSKKHKNLQGSKRKMVDWLIGKNNKRMTSSIDGFSHWIHSDLWSLQIVISKTADKKTWVFFWLNKENAIVYGAFIKKNIADINTSNEPSVL